MIAIFMLGMSTLSYGVSEPQAMIRGIRPLGMGGAFTAISDDQNAAFTNPAGLTQRQGSMFTLFEIPLNVSEDVMNFNNFYSDNSDKLKDFNNLSTVDQVDILNEINDKITAYKPSLRIGFPNTSFISGPGFLSWGIGLYTKADIGFKFNRSLLLPSISFWGNIDAVVAAPFAHKFDVLPYSVPGSVSVGTTLKIINRARLAEYNKSILEFEDFDPLLQMGKGFGLDLGTMYHLNPRWNFGMQITDVGGTNLAFDSVTADKAGQVDKESYTGMIKSEWNFGVAYVPSKIVYWPGRSINTLDRLILAADIKDAFNADEPLLEATFFKKLHLGAEFRFSTLSLRTGYNSGYPTFGFGARVPYLGARVDYAYWADELGRYVGQDPEWNHQITFAWSWGDEKGRAFGSDLSSKEAVASEEVVEPKKEPVPVVTEPKPEETLTPSTTTAILIDGAQSSTTTGVKPAVTVPAVTQPVQPVVEPAPAKPATAVPELKADQTKTK